MSAAGFSPLLLLGPASAERAEVVVVDRGPDGSRPGARIEGRLTGPRCSRGTMLPTTVPLVAVAGGAGALSRGILTEPAYWQPDVPALYRLEAGLVVDGRTVATSDTLVGLRRSGTRGGALWLEGRCFVPRAVGCAELTEPVAEALRAAAAAAWIDAPGPDGLRLAAAAGVAVVARIGAGSRYADAAMLADLLVDLGACPAVVVAVFSGDIPAPVASAAIDRAGRLRGTVPVAWEVDGSRAPPAEIPAGVEALVVALPDGVVPDEGWLRPPSVPLLATWQSGAAEAPAASRARCDRLQAALAAWGARHGGAASLRWAGYVAG